MKIISVSVPGSVITAKTAAGYLARIAAYLLADLNMESASVLAEAGRGEVKKGRYLIMKKFGVMARNRGMWGGRESWCKDEDGKPILFRSYEEAAAEAEKYRREAGPVNNFNSYFPKEYND